eukprot:353620-Chlamydomonas_euryale.AAC.2
MSCIHEARNYVLTHLATNDAPTHSARTKALTHCQGVGVNHTRGKMYCFHFATRLRFPPRFPPGSGRLEPARCPTSQTQPLGVQTDALE